MTTHSTTDALIVGGGPTGLTLACELARRGIAFRLLEKRAQRQMISKAAAIMPRSLEAFENIGVVDAFLKAGNINRRAAIYSGEKQIVSMGFEELDTPFPFILGLPQYETERILEEHLARRHGALERSYELTDFTQDNEGVTASVTRPDGSEETIRTK